MHILLTTCTARKRTDAALLPAIDRYVDPRIEHAASWAAQHERPLMIFSGVYGLLAASDPIPYYDHALEAGEVAAAADALAARITALGIDTVSALLEPRSAAGWAPYHDALVRGCQLAGVRLVVLHWDPRQQRLSNAVGDRRPEGRPSS
ncbi:MAG TPA: hypothetical protein DFR83_13795 [Deltaproteobacteria bacterium]|nr:hypothetical protein [Deltaproteobacteria bacterium]